MPQISELLTRLYALKIGQRGNELAKNDETHERIRQVAEWIVNGQTSGLLLQGTLGTGKTTLAWCIREAFKIIGDKCSWVTAGELVRSKLDPSSVVYTYEERRDAGILFIEELGTEGELTKVYGNEERPMRDLLTHRYEKPTLITIATTNLTPDQFRDFYGERVDDRCAETFDIIGYGGESYRRR